jgi:hypothetical protein
LAGVQDLTRAKNLKPKNIFADMMRYNESKKLIVYLFVIFAVETIISKKKQVAGTYICRIKKCNNPN